MKTLKTPDNIDDYIENFPSHIQEMLTELRATIKRAAPSAIALFKNELSAYKNAKGSIQFPLDKPLPLDLITSIVTFRVNENIKKAELKTKKSQITKI